MPLPQRLLTHYDILSTRFDELFSALNAISERELAEMMSPQAMRNYMYEHNRRKNRDLKFLSCDHGCDYKTKDVAVYQQHIRFTVLGVEMDRSHLQSNKLACGIL